MANTECFYCPVCKTRWPRRSNTVPKAQPICPKCAPAVRMMKLYATVDLNWPPGVKDLSDNQMQNLVKQMPPLAPGRPKLENLLDQETVIYSGSGSCPRRGMVLYRLTKNAAKGMVSLYIDTNPSRAATEATTRRLEFHLSLLPVPPPTKDTLIKSPFGGTTAWAVIKKNELGGSRMGAWDQIPDEIKIGVSVGDSRFGLIHLLSGHATTLNTYLNSGPGHAAVFRTNEASDRMALNTNGLHGLLTGSFGAESLSSIDHAGDEKIVLRSLDQRKLVINRQGAAPHHTVTTMYGSSEPFGESASTAWSRT